MNAPHRRTSVSDSIHERLVRWATERAKSDYECCVLLLAAARSELHRALGFATAVQYGAAVTGLTTRQVRERLRVAKALEALPELNASFAAGRMAYTKMRVLTRVVTAGTERAWIAEAETLTASAVQELCSGRRNGDLPSSPAKDEARRYRLELEDVEADARALLVEARRVLTEEHGGALDDSQFVRALAQTVLRSDRNPERASYQIALSECPSCKTVRQRSGGRAVVVEPVVLARARCDAQDIGDVDGAEPTRATQTVPPAVRRQVLARHDNCCAVPDCRLSAFVDVHHVRLRSEGGTHDPDLLVPLCTNHHDLAHRGRLIIRGSFSTGFTFERADGTEPRLLPLRSLRRADAFGQAFGALRALGFKSREAQHMLDLVRTSGTSGPVETIVPAPLRAAPVNVTRVAEARPRYEQTTPRGRRDMQCERLALVA